MTRKKTRRAAAVTNHIDAGPAQTLAVTSAEAFSFGDPVAVLDRRELLDYVECMRVGEWFEPPLPFDGLARSFRAAVHNSSPIYVKRNMQDKHAFKRGSVFHLLEPDKRCTGCPNTCRRSMPPGSTRPRRSSGGATTRTAVTPVSSST